MCTQHAESLVVKFAGNCALPARQRTATQPSLGRDSGTKTEYIRNEWKMEHESETREEEKEKERERERERERE